MAFKRAMKSNQLMSAVCILVLVGALSPLVSGLASSAEQATPEAPIGLGCTIWRTSAESPTTPDECTTSPPWWTSWSGCNITPVHSEPWTGTNVQSALMAMSWFEVDMDGVTATAFLFLGNRPLPVGKTFPDGSFTKVLWRFDEPISNFSITATHTRDAAYTDVPAIQTGPANTSGDTSTEWPSYVFVPAPGCWGFELTATTTDDRTVTGSFTYVAVE